jgi:hypothetical protein
MCYFLEITALKMIKGELGTVAHVCNLSYSGGGGRKIKVQGQPGQKHKTSSKKQTKPKRAGCMAKVEKCLLRKCKTLNSNPSITKKKKRNWKEGLTESTRDRDITGQTLSHTESGSADSYDV